MAGEQRHGISLSSLDDELFAGAGATKRDLLDHLEAVADVMLPGLVDRPLSVIRVRPGQPAFMQKNLPAYAPASIRRVPQWAEASHREVATPSSRTWRGWCGSATSARWSTTCRCTGWPSRTGHRAGARPRPARGHRLRRRRGRRPGGPAGARRRRPGRRDQDQRVEGRARRGAAGGRPRRWTRPPRPRALAVRAERVDPALTTTAYLMQDRAGKVFLDPTRAGGGTLAAVYSPRVRPGTTVSFPLAWDDLDAVTPADFTVRTVPGLLGTQPSWAERLPAPQELPADLVAEGHEIPVARVPAMHEGKRRKRAREAGDGEARSRPLSDARGLRSNGPGTTRVRNQRTSPTTTASTRSCGRCAASYASSAGIHRRPTAPAWPRRRGRAPGPAAPRRGVDPERHVPRNPEADVGARHALDHDRHADRDLGPPRPTRRSPQSHRS